MSSANFFDAFDWHTMLSQHPFQKVSVSDYHRLLCPEPPDFLGKYLELPILQRLSGVGLLCGTDWTQLYKNRFYYSRLDHSLGVALVTWNFTRDKAQTVAALLHDVSTPVFSHVSDFRKGDALTQTATEASNSEIIRRDGSLLALLSEDGLAVEQVQDYHIYPVCDNEIPRLSADRLEYMFPSGMALDGSWTLPQIDAAYNNLELLKNEDGRDELGFCSVPVAEDYCLRFCMTGHILQLNENKLTLSLLGEIMNSAVREGILVEDDFMRLSERQVLDKLESSAEGRLLCLYKTFRGMQSIVHTDVPLPDSDYFNVSLKVKQRYINPLVKNPADGGLSAIRLSEASARSKRIISDFLAYEDTLFGAVRLVRY